MVSNSLANSKFPDLNAFITQADPLVWETISILTRSSSDKQSTSSSSSRSIKYEANFHSFSSNVLHWQQSISACPNAGKHYRLLWWIHTANKSFKPLRCVHQLRHTTTAHSSYSGRVGNKRRSSRVLNWHGTTVQEIQTKPSRPRIVAARSVCA